MVALRGTSVSLDDLFGYTKLQDLLLLIVAQINDQDTAIQSLRKKVVDSADALDGKFEELRNKQAGAQQELIALPSNLGCVPEIEDRLSSLEEAISGLPDRDARLDALERKVAQELRKVEGIDEVVASHVDSLLELSKHGTALERSLEALPERWSADIIEVVAPQKHSSESLKSQVDSFAAQHFGTALHDKQTLTTHSSADSNADVEKQAPASELTILAEEAAFSRKMELESPAARKAPMLSAIPAAPMLKEELPEELPVQKEALEEAAPQSRVIGAEPAADSSVPEKALQDDGQSSAAESYADSFESDGEGIDVAKPPGTLRSTGAKASLPRHAPGHADSDSDDGRYGESFESDGLLVMSPSFAARAGSCSGEPPVQKGTAATHGGSDRQGSVAKNEVPRILVSKPATSFAPPPRLTASKENMMHTSSAMNPPPLHGLILGPNLQAAAEGSTERDAADGGSDGGIDDSMSEADSLPLPMGTPKAQSVPKVAAGEVLETPGAPPACDSMAEQAGPACSVISPAAPVGSSSTEGLADASDSMPAGVAIVPSTGDPAARLQSSQAQPTSARSVVSSSGSESFVSDLVTASASASHDIPSSP